MLSLLQVLFIVMVLIGCFLRWRGQQASPSRALLPPLAAPEVPHHANGRAMTIREVYIWRSMQQVISEHWRELSTISDTKVRSYRPADRDWGGVIQVYGITHLELHSGIGSWAAEISPEGRVEVPHEKP